MRKTLRRIGDYLEDLQWRPWFYPALLVLWVVSWGSLFVRYPDPFLLTGPQLAQKIKAEQVRHAPRWATRLGDPTSVGSPTHWSS